MVEQVGPDSLLLPVSVSLQHLVEGRLIDRLAQVVVHAHLKAHLSRIVGRQGHDGHVVGGCLFRGQPLA